jgi:cyclopropane-fatty-acyl-phospholipid synthase
MLVFGFKPTREARMRFLPRLLKGAIRKGRLTLETPDGTRHVFGGAEPGPEVAIRITDPSLDWRIAFNPELKAAEAFMDQTLQVVSGPEGGTAYDLLHIFFINKKAFDLSPGQILVRSVERTLRRFIQHNPVIRARRNAAHHYDLGNDFYRMWLDPDMQYSCGYWPEGTETLAEAQTRKKRHIAAKLALEPGQRVLDIGCGWGGMALYLAAVADVEVVGVTLAKRQLEVARARAEMAGLADKVRFELMDYRDVKDRFDRVVSVGMLEHVGVGYLQTYFLKVRDRLGPDGVALIHTISSKAPPGISGPFLRKYIFPGGYAPCLSEVALAIERSGLWNLDTEVWRVHYAPTLRAWRERFEARRDDVETMYDPRFARMWEFYLAACECAFAYGSSNVLQLQLGRERDAVPLHRDYVQPAEAALAEREPEALARIDAATREVFGEPPLTRPEAAPDAALRTG